MAPSAAQEAETEADSSWRSTSGCHVTGQRVAKDSEDRSWSVALGFASRKEGRTLWFVKVGGKTGRMAVGVAARGSDDVATFRPAQISLPGPQLTRVPAGVASSRGVGRGWMRWKGVVLHLSRNVASR